MQNLLIALGDYEVVASGSSDASTRAAIVAFQNKHRLGLTGEASTRLLFDLAAAYSRRSPTFEVNPAADALSPREVTLLTQQLLTGLGYGRLQLSGAPNDYTRHALAAFERDAEIGPFGAPPPLLVILKMGEMAAEESRR